MSRQSYQLVNPVIEGTFKDVYEGNDQYEAAEAFWLNLSKHIVGYVPRFLFTLKNISSADLHHFEVAENGKTNQYKVKELNIEIDKKLFDDFLKNIDKASATKGGGKDKRKRYSDSSSSSSSSIEYYPSTYKRTDPIAIFNYLPRVYFGPSKTVVETPVIPTVAVVSTDDSAVDALIYPVYTPAFKFMSPFVALWH